MKSKSLFFFVVFLALGTLETLAVERSGKKSQKAGACPPRKHVLCSRYEEPECKSDWQCPGEKRCCSDYCGIKCLDPVDISKSARKKPGKCPVANAECLMLNPPNFCEKDGQCEGKLKCCKGMCGKACIPPRLIPIIWTRLWICAVWLGNALSVPKFVSCLKDLVPPPTSLFNKLLTHGL